MFCQRAPATNARTWRIARRLSTQPQPDIPSISNDTPPDQIKRQRAKKPFLFRTTAGVVLNRPPILTRQLTSFEKAFYDYQLSLKQKLVSPFPEDFYFQKGSAAAKRWQEGAGVRAAQVDDQNVAPREVESSNIHPDADRRSLDRRPSTSLYLLLKKKRSEHAWQLPQDAIGSEESLHGAANRLLETQIGPDINLWTVSRAPIGFIAYEFQSPNVGYNGAKVYFTKHRLLAGQVRLHNDYEDYAWLSPSEIKETVDAAYWKSISPLLGPL
jgi:large subunit ribosomal protein L46